MWWAVRIAKVESSTCSPPKVVVVFLSLLGTVSILDCGSNDLDMESSAYFVRLRMFSSYS